MAKQDKNHHDFEVHIGGIFAQPRKTKTGRVMNPTGARKKLEELLKSEEVVQKVWELPTNKLSDEDWGYLDRLIVAFVGDKEQNITYNWLYPLIFKLKVPQGSLIPNTFSDTNQTKRKTISSIEAIIFYNGCWFMALVDNKQFLTLGERFDSGPDIRDILVGIFERNKLLTPVVVPPCIIPMRFQIELRDEGNEEEKPLLKYIRTLKYEGARNFAIQYQAKTADITDKQIVEIMKDIYFDVRSSFDSFYILAAKGDRTQDKHRDVLEMYDQACSDLQEYVKIPFWNLVKKCSVANALSKNVSNIQVQLVDNRLSQVRILNGAEEINMFEDKKDIIRNIKEYLKECVVKDFDLGTIEYEGLMTTLSHIERLASQHNIILLGIVAIIAAFMGAIIGAWIG